ncbi:MAG: sensor domain-containing diguanylate cyclase [Spirochaetes bacterium]|nr:sensor domain-containing diguanylate cyclase [Spirochaetota bacterium]MBU0954093.1 sensor domain-containing diguanylate cyclase [Spirochaetota bacterium]
MQLQQQSYERIIENLYGGLYFVDLSRTITYWNKAAEQISGFSSEEVVGRRCADNILTHVDAEGCSLCNGDCPLAATMRDGCRRETTVYLHHKAGHRVPVSVRASPLYDDNGNISGGIELFIDDSQRVVSETRIKELEKLALMDKLTSLANRAYIDHELAGRLGEFREVGLPFGVLFMDIDHFKNFNDRHGHDAGDQVLKFVAGTLISNSRPFDLYGRWGGEEFIGILRNVDQTALVQIAERLRMLVQNAYLIHSGEKLSVTISIGATLVQKGDTVESLIQRADKLLYTSKRTGRNRVSLTETGN